MLLKIKKHEMFSLNNYHGNANYNGKETIFHLTILGKGYKNLKKAVPMTVCAPSEVNWK